MADIADEASDLLENELQFAFHSRKRHTLARTGSCHYCEATVGTLQLFCDSECAGDHERLQAAARRLGTNAPAAVLRG